MKPFDEDLPPKHLSITDELLFYLYKPLYHIRLFMQQRAMLREDPERTVTPPPEVPEDNWVPPGFFALEGLLVTAIVVEMLSSVLSVFFVRPMPYQTRIINYLNSYIWAYDFYYDRARTAHTPYVMIAATHPYKYGEQFLLADLSRPPAFPPTLPAKVSATLLKRPTSFYADGERVFFTIRGYQQELVQGIGLLQREETYIPIADPTLETVLHWLYVFAFPVSLLMSSTLFRWLFLHTQDGRNACNREKIPQIYLYMTTAVFFWPNLINAIYGAVLQFLAVYTGWYDYGATAAYMAGGRARLASTLAEYSTDMTWLQLLVIIPIGLIALNRLSKTIRRAFCLPPSPFFTDGVVRSVYLSNFCNAVIVNYAVSFTGGYFLALVRFLQAHQVNLILKRWR